MHGPMYIKNILQYCLLMPTSVPIRNCYQPWHLPL